MNYRSPLLSSSTNKNLSTQVYLHRGVLKKSENHQFFSMFGIKLFLNVFPDLQGDFWTCRSLLNTCPPDLSGLNFCRRRHASSTTLKIYPNIFSNSRSYYHQVGVQAYCTETLSTSYKVCESGYWDDYCLGQPEFFGTAFFPQRRTPSDGACCSLTARPLALVAAPPPWNADALLLS